MLLNYRAEILLILLTTIPSEKKSTRPPRIWIPKKDDGKPCVLPRRQQLNKSMWPAETEELECTAGRLQQHPFCPICTSNGMFGSISD